MNWLERLSKAVLPRQARLPERQDVAIVQPMARPSWQLTPFGFVNPFYRIPAKENLYLNEQLVEMIPIIGAAVDRITQLVGCPKVESENKALAAEVNDWWMNLKVNRVQTGGGNLFSGWIKSHLVYGRAHVEIIPSATYRDVYALQLLHSRTIEARPRENRYGVEWVQQWVTFGEPRLLDDDLLLTIVHDVRDDNPNGTSLLYGLPFVAEIYNKLLASLKETWERFGVPSYVVRYIPNENISDPDGTRGTAFLNQALAGLQSHASARANGMGRDFGVVGDGSIEILGANGETLDIEVPGRQILEQIVAKTGLPPWMLGLHWSTTERMSSVQASLLSEQIDEVREHAEAEWRYLVDLRQALVGRPLPEGWKTHWDAPSLIDQMETATAKKAEEEAQSARLKRLEREWTLGIRQDWEVARDARPDLEGATEAEVRAACPDLLAQPPVPMMLPAAGPGGREEGGREEGEQPANTARPFGRSLTYGGNGRH
jgi:hypothetical protein